MTWLPAEEQIQKLMLGVEYGDASLFTAMEEELRERLAEGRPLRVYCGFDPTSTDLTLGNMVPMLKLRQFQEFGHEVTFLIGTMTATIGDPTGRTTSRPTQTLEEVEQKAETWLRQAFRVLDQAKTHIKRNGDWLYSLTLPDIVQIASNFTVAQFLAHETFRQRYIEEVPIHLHEFIYALMQGYDALVMNTDVQIGGTDQLFNIMAGRTIQRANGQKPQVALCVPLLVGTDGKQKMSKSLGNYIGLDEAPAEMFGKIMKIPDETMFQYITLLTPSLIKPYGHILDAIYEHQFVDPRVKMNLKKLIGREVVTLLYSADDASKAEEEFERVIQRREAPELGIEAATRRLQELFNQPGARPEFVDIPNGKALVIPASDVGIDWRPGWARSSGPGYNLSKILLDAGLVQSASEARRLVRQGAVTIDGIKLTQDLLTEQQFGQNSTIRIGRHKFLRVIWQ